MQFASHLHQEHGPATIETVDELAGRMVEHIGPRPTLLAVWAHPDDESYLGGGLMAALAEAGARVVNVTATLGEHGTDDPRRFPPERLRTIRHAELHVALGHLGSEPATVLGYEDGTVADVPLACGARHVGRLLDELRPDAVLSFGPDGVTGHDDHRAVARWTAQAISDRDGRIPLITTAVAAAWPDELVTGMHRVDAFFPGFPERTLHADTRTVHVDGHLLDRKLAALASHASQVGPLHTELGADGYRRLASIEAYRPSNAAARRMLTASSAPALAAA
jgi:LmbE family N-acetylglucosaminyl deacetylase